MARDNEHKEQAAVVPWFKLQYPRYKNHIIAIPNGAHLAGTVAQRAIKMRKMKAEGFKAGTSDLFIAVPKESFHGLWVEMKATGKTKCSVSDSQWEHIYDMRSVGYEAYPAYGQDHAMQIIKDYMACQ